MPRALLRRLPLLVLAVALLAPAPARAGEEPSVGPRGPAEGGLSWLLSGDLDLVGSVWAEIPFARSAAGHGFVAADTRTAIRKASSLTFDVRDLEYSLETGGRRDLSDRVRLTGLLGQRGLEPADLPGSRFVRYVGGGVDARLSSVAGRASLLEGELVVGAIVDDRAVDANALARARVRWTARRARLGYGADLRVETLAGGSDTGTDLEAGPRLDLFLAGAPVASFHLRYLRARSPLGLQTSGALVGFEYATRVARGGSLGAPDVAGSLAAAAGDDRRGGARLDLSVSSPPFPWRRARVGADVEANVLTSESSDDLYYLYRVGVDAEVGCGLVGVGFRHRSNHRLAEAGPGVTSVNVVEAGWESAGWRAPHLGASSARGRLAGRLRLGALLDTDFGRSGGVHISAAGRYLFAPFLRGSRPFVAVEGEAGGAELRSYEVGLALPRALELSLGYRSDEQWSGPDRTAILLTARASF